MSLLLWTSLSSICSTEGSAPFDISGEEGDKSSKSTMLSCGY